MPLTLIDPVWQPVANELRRISSLTLGLTDPLTTEENYEIRRFLKQRFQDFNQEEITAAFDMYCARELDLDYKKVGHYNKLSTDFVGMVLSSYRDYRSEKLRDYKPLPPPEKKPVDPVEYWDTNFFPRYEALKAGEPYNFNQLEGTLAYGDLYTLIEADFSNEEIQAYKDKAARFVHKKKAPNIWLTKDMERDYKERKLAFAKHLAFQDWIQAKALEGVDLRPLILPLITNQVT